MDIWFLIMEIVLLLGVAFLFGVVAQRLNQSAIVGYLLAGAVLGPIMFNKDAVQEVAELGVALLLFLRWLQQPKSLLLLIVGHVVITLPYILLVVQARLVGIKRVYEEAAMSLGANALQTFKEITLPLLAPAIIAGMLFAFTISFDDITATLFWATARTSTVPVKILGMLRHHISPEINALGTVMVILTISTPLLAGYLARRFARGLESSKR